MPDDNDLFESSTTREGSVTIPATFETNDEYRPAPIVGTAEASKSSGFKDKIREMIDKYFPHMEGGGVEAHQPMRDFCLEVLDKM